MSERAFKVSLFALATAILLSSTTFPGALLGFLFGVTIAFFVAGPSFLAAAALQEAGIQATDKTIAIILVTLYALFTMAAIVHAWWAWSRGPAPEARLKIFRAALLVALPLMGWLSAQALVRAWP